jgi:gas vesicle protein
MKNVVKFLIGGLVGSVVTYAAIRLINDNKDETKEQEAEVKNDEIIKAANEKVNALNNEIEKTNADNVKLAEKLEKASKECKSAKKDSKKLQNKLDNIKEEIEFKKVQLEACEKIAEIIDEAEYKDEITYTDGTARYMDHYESSVIETSINAIHAIADAEDDDEVIEIVKEAVSSLEDFFKELDSYEEDDDDDDEDDEDSDDETEDDEDENDEEDADLSASIDQLIYGGDDADEEDTKEGDNFSNQGELITEDGGSPLQTNKTTTEQPVVEDTPDDKVFIITGKNGIKDTTGQVEIIRPYPKYRPDGSIYYDGSLLYRNGPDTWVWDDSTNKALGKLFTELFGNEGGNDEFSTLSDRNKQNYRSSSRNRKQQNKHNVDSKEEEITKGEDSKEKRPQDAIEVEEITTEYVESAPTEETDRRYSDRYVLSRKVKNATYRRKYFYIIANAIDDENIRNEQLSKIVYILNRLDQLTGTDKMKYELKMDAIIQEIFNPRGINVFQEIDKIWKLIRG